MKAPHLISAETLLENLRDYTIVEIAYDPHIRNGTYREQSSFIGGISDIQ
jgi:hypothetical protein